jgi:hypothetical protein
MIRRLYHVVAALTSAVAGFALAESHYLHQYHAVGELGWKYNPNWLGMVGGHFLMGAVVTFSVFLLVEVALWRVPISARSGVLSMLGSSAFVLLWAIKDLGQQLVRVSHWRIYFDRCDFALTRDTWLAQWGDVALVVLTIFYVNSFARSRKPRCLSWSDCLGYAYSAVVVLLALAEWIIR